MNYSFPETLQWVLDQLAQQKKSAATLAGYRRNLRRLDRELGGLLRPPSDVRAALEAWRTKQQKLHMLQPSHPNHISASKIACDITVLRTFYRELVRRKRYPENPALDVNSMPLPKTLPRPMPFDLYTRLCGAVDISRKEGVRDRTMIEICYHGLRNHEVCNLTTDSLTFSLKDRTFYIRLMGKGGKERVVALNPDSATLMALHIMHWFIPNEWREWQTEITREQPGLSARDVMLAIMDRLFATRWQSSAALFLTDQGRQVTTNWFNRRFRKLRAQAGLGEQWGPHSLRHSCATELLAGGNDIRVVQVWLGHSSIRTTAGYTEVLPEGKLATSKSLRTPASLMEVAVA